MSTEILNYSSGKISAKLERSSKILLSDVHFSVSSGESVALIGETGSGKTMAALSIMGLLPTNVTMLDSRIIFCRREADPNFMKKLLGVELVYIPQNGAEFLNPSRKIKDHLFDSLRKLGCRRSEMHSHAVSALRVSGFEHREAAEAYNDALQLKSNDLSLLRRRAGRYISTLQCAKALEGFERCMVMGGDRLDHAKEAYRRAWKYNCADFDKLDDNAVGVPISGIIRAYNSLLLQPNPYFGAELNYYKTFRSAYDCAFETADYSAQTETIGGAFDVNTALKEAVEFQTKNGF